jgi:electron transfer flavoprotein alpha/beta subunit
MKAKKKEIKEIGTQSIVPLHEKTSIVSYVLSNERHIGKQIDGDPETQAKTLVELLRNEAKII